MRKTQNNSPDPIAAITETLTNHADTCFGKEFSSEASECSQCGMRTVCMVLSCKKLDDAAKVKFSNLSFADEICWDNVPYDLLVNTLKSTPYSVKDVQDVFREYSKCTDPVTINLRVGKFIRDYNLKIEEGCIKA